ERCARTATSARRNHDDADEIAGTNAGENRLAVSCNCDAVDEIILEARWNAAEASGCQLDEVEMHTLRRRLRHVRAEDRSGVAVREHARRQGDGDGPGGLDREGVQSSGVGPEPEHAELALLGASDDEQAAISERCRADGVGEHESFVTTQSRHTE